MTLHAGFTVNSLLWELALKAKRTEMKSDETLGKRLQANAASFWGALTGERVSPWGNQIALCFFGSYPCNTPLMPGNVRIPATADDFSDLSSARWGPVCSNNALFENVHFLESSDFSHVGWFSRQSVQLSAQRTFRDAISTVMQQGMCENMFLAYIQIRRSRVPSRAERRAWFEKQKHSSFTFSTMWKAEKEAWICFLVFFIFPKNED